MKLHIIQNMATGERMPYGGTSAEPTNDLPPRLYPSKAAAETSLRAWKDGVWRTTREWDDHGYVQGLPEPVDGPAADKLRAERAAMDLRVREVRLEVVSGL